MNAIGGLVDEAARNDFLKGFYAVAVVLGVFGVGLEFGAASAGDGVSWAAVVAMGGGASVSGVALWRLLAES